MASQATIDGYKCGLHWVFNNPHAAGARWMTIARDITSPGIKKSVLMDGPATGAELSNLFVNFAGGDPDNADAFWRDYLRRGYEKYVNDPDFIKGLILGMEAALNDLDNTLRKEWNFRVNIPARFKNWKPSIP